jgi:hypothetical protein
MRQTRMIQTFPPGHPLLQTPPVFASAFTSARGAAAPGPVLVPETEEQKIRSACGLAGRPDLAGEFLREGTSYAGVLKYLSFTPAKFAELVRRRVAARSGSLGAA